MFITEVVVSGGVALDWIILKCAPNILPLSCLLIMKFIPTGNHNLCNKHIVKLIPL